MMTVGRGRSCSHATLRLGISTQFGQCLPFPILLPCSALFNIDATVSALHSRSSLAGERPSFLQRKGCIDRKMSSWYGKLSDGAGRSFQESPVARRSSSDSSGARRHRSTQSLPRLVHQQCFRVHLHLCHSIYLRIISCDRCHLYCLLGFFESLLL